MRTRFLAAATASFLLAAAPAAALAKPAISLVLDGASGTPAKIAWAKVRAALQQKQVSFEEVARMEAAQGDAVLVAGIAKGSPAFVKLAHDISLELPTEPQSLAVRRASQAGRKLMVVAGGDDLGLAYALYDVAARIGWTAPGADALSEVRDIRETPAVRDRSVCTYTMQQAYFESHLFNEDYWAKYFDTLVQNRFNNYSLLFGYESSGYLAPPYAWFFDLPQFPEVKAAGVSREQQEHYTRALNRVIDMAHERGLQFTLGIWDHIYDGVSSYYTPGVWDHLPEVNGRKPRWPVEGLTDKNLVAYTQAALRRFLEVVPHLDGIQFRMHGESGLSRAGMRNFWEPIFQIMSKEHPNIRFDARAKEFPPDLVDLAVKMGVPMRLVLKYIAEQAGMPFSPIHVPRSQQFGTRAGYADHLRYPKDYGLQWRLWTAGTMRLLLWSDPEYARRYAETTHVYDGDGFDVAEPLATKMASQPHNQADLPILNSQYRYYDYEFERYWAFYQAFGRMSYNPATASEVWDREFERHYGKEAGPYIERALHQASGVMPRIIGYNLPSGAFPTTRGWPERQPWEDLPNYSKGEPSDTGLFASIQEEAHNLLAGLDTAKIRPEETSRWFDSTAKAVLAQVSEAERRAGAQPNKEFRSATVDLRIIAHLAEYHARRIHSGLNYALFTQSGDVTALDQAIAWERRALEAWEALVQSAGDVYSDNLAFGVPEDKLNDWVTQDMAGHWRDELPKLRAAIQVLERQRATFHPETVETVAKYDFGSGPTQDGYQHLPSRADFTLDLPTGDYRLQFTLKAGPSQTYGPMWIEADGSARTDIFRVKPGETVERTLDTSARGGKLNVTLANDSTGRWGGVSRMIVTRVDPRISHVPVRSRPPEEAVTLRATVAGADEIRAVRAWFGDSAHGFTAREMRASGPNVYVLDVAPGTLPAAANYYLEAVDAKGRVTRFPQDGETHPIGIALRTDTQPPVFRHTPVTSAHAGRPLRIVAEAEDQSGVRSVQLRYRSVNQRQDYGSIAMLPTGKPHEYAAEIPAGEIVSKWDFMYYFEVIDNQGNGKIYPDGEKETPYVVVKLER